MGIRGKIKRKWKDTERMGMTYRRVREMKVKYVYIKSCYHQACNEYIELFIS